MKTTKWCKNNTCPAIKTNGLKENNENQICHKPQEGKHSFHITIPRTIAHEKVVKRLYKCQSRDKSSSDHTDT